MSEQSLQSRIEVILLFVCALLVVMWAISKCRSKSRYYLDREKRELEEKRKTQKEDSIAEFRYLREQKAKEAAKTQQAEQKATDQQAAPEKPGKQEPEEKRETNRKDEKSAKPSSDGQRLYVTIDELKVRKLPSLKSQPVQSLKIFEEVTFLNEVTDFKEELNLGKVKANEPWVKIRTKKGNVGWVYGAGVSFYKKRNPGVW